MTFRNTNVHPVAFIDADRAFTTKLFRLTNDFGVQELLLQYYPAGMPVAVSSWGELLYIILIS
jgi:hypothetical protein